MEPHPTTNRQSCFKHQILSKSNKNCKIFQNSQKRGTHEVSGHFDTIWPNFNPPIAKQELRRRQCRRHQIFDQSLWMVSKYLQKAPRQFSSQTDTVWPSINSRTAKSSFSAARTTEAITHQAKYMGSFYMLPKGCTSIFRSFRQRLTRHWRSETKSSLPVAELPETMASKSELMHRLKMTPIGSLSNFRSIGHRLTAHQNSTSSTRWNQV